jgi:hypothetical protein
MSLKKSRQAATKFGRQLEGSEKYNKQRIRTSNLVYKVGMASKIRQEGR